ncbi:cytochrome-c peroxidase [Iodobacter arcticus]|uniref:Cytochrome-c peroxidase n=1 Tax=Iodobacter arcticus TaxID=590593 RepID=A0ABW2QZ09_9NEIS
MISRWLLILICINVHAQSPEQKLGEALFFDTRLSSNQRISCASCHHPDKAFSDGLATSVGVTGQALNRKSTSLFDVGKAKFLFWDGRRENLKDLIFDPLTNPMEHGFTSDAEVLLRLNSLLDIQQAFYRLNGRKTIDKQDVQNVMVAYLQGLKAPQTAFDRFRSGDKNALSASQLKGYKLFTGVAACVQCHQINEGRFTDDAFHALGAESGKISKKLPQLLAQTEIARKNGTLGVLIATDADVAELGRYLATANPMDIAAFKTPSLRQVKKLAPYMHNGSVSTLSEAVRREAYYRASMEGKSYFLTPEEVEVIVDFLRVL